MINVNVTHRFISYGLKNWNKKTMINTTINSCCKIYVLLALGQSNYCYFSSNTSLILVLVVVVVLIFVVVIVLLAIGLVIVVVTYVVEVVIH